MRRMLSHTLDAVQQLVPGSEPTAPLFRDVRENTESMHFYADELLDDVNTLLNIQLALASHRTGEVMRVLTVFSVFFLPLTFIVGIYGMNFHYMPELRERWGYPAVLVADGAGDPGDLPLVPPPGLAARMMEAVALLVLAVGSGVLGWLLGRQRAPACSRSGVAPHLLPDPALEWLRRLIGAIGVWIAELDPQEEGPRAERIVEPERLSVAQIVAVDRRLERARDQEQSGAERMEGGMLVFHAQAGSAVGLLLPDKFEAGGLDGVEDDLRRLLDGVRRRPNLVALAQAQSQEASLESVGSVGLRLAYQLERTLDAR